MSIKDDKSFIRVFVVAPQGRLADKIESVEGNGRAIDMVGDASTLEESIRSISRVKPDVIILDSELGETSSLGRLSEIIAASPISRILLLSKNMSDEISERALLDGAHGLLLTTTRIETLVTAVRKLHDGELWFDRKLTSRILSQADTRNFVGSRENTSVDRLTKRELDITRLIAKGLANKEIALRLNLSEKTVRNHLSTIYSKMGVTNRLGLALLVSNNGLGA